MPKFSIVPLANKEEWLQYWKALPISHRDVFSHPAFIDALKSEDAIGECALFEASGQHALFPYLRRPIHMLHWVKPSELMFDIESVTGFGGPRGELASAELWEQFFSEFGAHCRSTGVVAEFVRVHPMIPMESAMARHYVLKHANNEVVVNLQRTPADIWADYQRNNRKNVAAAQRNHVTVSLEGPNRSSLHAFMAILESTLERRGAPASARIPLSVFHALHDNIPDQLLYAIARHQGKVVSAELCLCSNGAFYSFLGGTDATAFGVRPNNLLKHEIILEGVRRGLSYYMLGGGREMDDGIFQYKRSFAPEGIRPYFVAGRIHDQERYDQLCKRCQVLLGDSAAQARKWFLPWRHPLMEALSVTR